MRWQKTLSNFTKDFAGGDYPKELNPQLYKLVGLTKSEIAYLEKTIRDIDFARKGKSNP
jgi:hypothetical protein